MQTKKQINQKALEMFLDQGYDNTPMSHIAKELVISKAGLYHHYPSKESLLFDIIDYMNERNFIPFYEEANKISDPEKRLTFFLRRFMKMMTVSASARIAVQEAGRLKPEHFKKVKQSWRKTYDLLKDAISEMQTSGKAKEMNSAFAAMAAIGMCSWVFYWFDYSQKESGGELADTFVEIFLRGIRKGIE